MRKPWGFRQIFLRLLDYRQKYRITVTGRVTLRIIFNSQSFFTMGNISNPENWAARERLRFIERAAFWRGWLQREEMARVFGQSVQQCSADL